MQLAPAPLWLPPNWEKRQLEAVRGFLQDLPECKGAEFGITWSNGAPLLWIVFSNLPDACEDAGIGVAIPCFALRLVKISQSAPLSPGPPLEGDELKRSLRTNLETYFHKHGIRLYPENWFS